MSPQQNPALLVVGERYGEVALLSEQRHLLHLRQSELKKHNWSPHCTGTEQVMKDLPASKKTPFRKFLSFLS